MKIKSQLQLFLIMICTITLSTFSAQNSQPQSRIGQLTITNLCNDSHNIQFREASSLMGVYFLAGEKRNMPVHFKNNSAQLYFICDGTRKLLTIPSQVNHITVTQENKTFTLTTNVGTSGSFELE